MNLIKLHTSTELLGDHAPQEQKLNFLISSFSTELFNFNACQNDQATKTGSEVSVLCVCGKSVSEKEGRAEGLAAVFSMVRSLCGSVHLRPTIVCLLILSASKICPASARQSKSLL